MNGTAITNRLQNSFKIKDNNVYRSSYYWNFRTSSFKQVACLILLNKVPSLYCSVTMYIRGYLLSHLIIIFHYQIIVMGNYMILLHDDFVICHWSEASCIGPRWVFLYWPCKRVHVLGVISLLFQFLQRIWNLNYF